MVEDLELDDVDPSAHRANKRSTAGAGGPNVGEGLDQKAARISASTAVELKKLVFGSSRDDWNDAWMVQNFAFSDVVGLEYGIVQPKVNQLNYERNSFKIWTVLERVSSKMRDDCHTPLYACA